MSFTYGFYNYDPNDPGEDSKVYNAEQFSGMFEGIISDGVFPNIGNAFRVYPSPNQAENMVIISSGRAWFNRTWNMNDSDYYMDAPLPSASYYRIDALVIAVNRETRHNEFAWVQGEEAASNPVKPSIVNTDTIAKYPIAYVTRRPNVSVIASSDIEYSVGTDSLTPYVTGLPSPDVTGLIDDAIAAQNIPGQVNTAVNTAITNANIPGQISTGVSNAISNITKTVTKEITTSSWAQDTTSQSGTTLYKKSVSLNHVYVNSPSVDIGAASGSVLPTKTQQEMYDLLEYVTIDGTTLYLYAKDLPTSTFYINVEGAD